MPLHDIAERLRRVEFRDEVFVVPRLIGATAEGCRNVREGGGVPRLHPVHQKSKYLPKCRVERDGFDNSERAERKNNLFRL